MDIAERHIQNGVLIMKQKTSQKQREMSLIQVLWIGFRDRLFTTAELNNLIHSDFQQQAQDLLKSISESKPRYGVSVKITAKGYQLIPTKKGK